MRAGPAYVIAALAGILAGQPQTGPEDLYAKVRRRVLADIDRLPAYTCIQTSTRSVYIPPGLDKPRRCEDVIADRNANKPGPPRVNWERLRMDIAIVDKHEVYSWVGAKQFEANDVHELVGYGHTLTGAFGSLLYSVLSRHDTLAFSLEKVTAERRLLEYGYDTPLALSQYEVKVGPTRMTIPYSGSVVLDPQTEDLLQLNAHSSKLSGETGYCQVIDQVDYQRVRIGARDILLPRAASSTAVGNDGVEMVNEDSYSGCRQYIGESAIRFDDQATGQRASATEVKRKPPTANTILPAGLSFESRIETPIDSRTSATGDPIEAILRTPLRNPAGQTLVPAGARIHGRLLRFVEDIGRGTRKYKYEVGVRFQSIETGGVTVPLAAELENTSGNTSVPIRLNVPKSVRQPSYGLFFFYDERIRFSHLDARWITTAPE